MNEGPKPFACEVGGCDMTFTNEDHLNWHRKKHDMVLNLGLANKNNEVADQTPTPTRFIKNCEEVGLFQDLQNVNPFDEFFQKAVEITKNGGTLEVHEVNSEDTLHTPHILPHIEECHKKVTTNDIIVDVNSSSNDFTLNNVITVTDDGDQKEKLISEPLIEIHEDLTKKILSNTNPNFSNQNDVLMKDVKLKIKQTLQIRGKQKNVSPNKHNNSNIITICTKNNKTSNSSNVCSSSNNKEELRAMNRAAQVRCRKRKAQKWKEMESKIEFLKNENKKLKLENQLLKKELLLKNKSSNEEPEHNLEGNLLFLSIMK